MQVSGAHNKCLSFIQHREQNKEQEPYLVCFSLPAHYPLLSRVEKNAEILRRAAGESQNLVYRILESQLKLKNSYFPSS